MATGETGFDDITYDAKNAGLADIESFFEEVMAQDSERARRRHGVKPAGPPSSPG